MNIRLKNAIPGLMTMGTEFVADEDLGLRVFHNKKEVQFEELPDYVFNTIKTVMGNKSASVDAMKEFVFNRWGGLDRDVDIDENGNPGEAEYMPGHKELVLSNGNKISEAQLRVLEHIDLKDGEIKDKIFLSKYTVNSHVSAMLLATGFNNRAQLALMAFNKGVK